MRVVFLGTPEVSAVALAAILDSHHDVVAVVTQPDKPRGRSGAPQASEVKTLAIEHDVPVLQPPTPKDEGFAARLSRFEPEVLAVVAYGHILPLNVLHVAPAINAHFSLLPKYRGAAPVQRAIEAGEHQTGVTTFLLEAGVDSGPMLYQERVAIGDDETAGELLMRLGPVGARLLLASLDALETGTLEPQQQDPAAATPARKVTVEEAQIDWSRPAAQIACKVRAFNPSPGAWTTWRGKRVKIWRAETAGGSAAPGDPAHGAEIGTGEGLLKLVEVQPEGGKRMSGEDFARGHVKGRAGRFGEPAEPG